VDTSEGGTLDDLPQNDSPITSPEQDRFGINPLAAALARSIREQKGPRGSVIALNGKWGSGKSSAVNLVRHHLAESVDAGEIKIIDFACWWFRGEEALALAFFRELYVGLSPSVGDKVKKLIPKLGARLLRAGSAIGAVVDAIAMRVPGGVVEGTMEWLSGLIQQDESVEKLHRELSKALAEQRQRFLVVIDDIDRLSSDEALLIFRLVKSVGRLPNVMYLLVYDRELAEKIVSERFPAEGPHYLEKIIQAPFEIPEPLPFDLQRQLFAQLEGVVGAPSEDRMVHFMNVFHEVVTPEIRTPRDIVRLVNQLSVTWPAVAGDVDVGDFVALEAWRLLKPEIYRALRQNKDKLFEIFNSEHRRKEDIEEEYDVLLPSVTERERTRYKQALIRLFPALASVWSITHYSGTAQCARYRRACSPAHFDSYFRFAVSSEALTTAELERFIEQIADEEFVVSAMRAAVAAQRPAGGTKAAVILDELKVNTDRIPTEHVGRLLTALFRIADELDVERDRGGAFTLIDNNMRLHWLLRRLTVDRTTLAERSKIYMTACQGASLGWLANFVDSAWRDYHPRDGAAPESEERCLTTEEDAERLRELLRRRIVGAAADQSLSNHKELAFLLYRWADLDDAEVVKSWTTTLMSTDEGVRTIVSAFAAVRWTYSFEDQVARRSTRIELEGLDRIFDVAELRKRVGQLANASDSPEMRDFLNAWDRQMKAKDV
jgi:predicted KAP-like P-loop ATPase